MRKSLSLCLFLVATVTLFATSSKAPTLDPEKIRAHVKYLASDELEGRGMNQKGGDAAAQYIADQFKSYGLKPADHNGTYFQQVPMVGVQTLPDTTFSLVPNSGSPLALKLLDDYVTTNETQIPTADFEAPIVFVGYGITSPEYKWDDYKGYDLKGKVALLFVSEPTSDDPKFFKGKALTYYGRWTYKFEETARHGAIATLIIHRSDLASYGWSVVRNSWGGEKSFLKLDGTPKLEAASWIQQDVARKLVAMGGLDLDKLFQQAQSRDFKPIELPVKLKAHVASSVRPFNSTNVTAMLEGSDPARKAQAVLYTAHYDHFGIDKSKPAGANIYHGAIDNATGCGILLELARVWAATKPTPPRSILFSAVTAEEQGLLGSEFLGKHLAQLPVQPILDLNYDAIAPLGVPEEVEVGGAERTSFYPVVEATAKDFHLAIRPDARPEAGHYYRSDHFSLGRVGIPAFSISEGMKFQGHDTSWGEAQAKDYVDHRYHQPSDEYKPEMDFRSDAVMGNFGYVLGEKAANAAGVPVWLPGDEFEPAQKKLLSSEIDGKALFADRSDLQPIRLSPIVYPPLARQVRVGGEVRLHVEVGADGKVQRLDVLQGHPLLIQSVESSVREWQFQSAIETNRSFDLECVFEPVGHWVAKYTAVQNSIVRQPLHLVIQAAPIGDDVNYSASAK